MAKFSVSTPAASTNTNGNWEQALGFLNIALPNGDGELAKFGALTMKASNAAEKQMFADLSVSPEQEAEIVGWIKANMVITFRPNVPGGKTVSFGYKK